MVSRIEYREYTGRLRHPAWKGAVDIDAREVRVPERS